MLSYEDKLWRGFFRENFSVVFVRFGDVQNNEIIVRAKGTRPFAIDAETVLFSENQASARRHVRAAARRAKK